MMQHFKVTGEDKKFILFFGALTFLYVLPMLIANTPYNDDFCRILIGNSWDDDGRLLPSLLMRFLVHATTIYDPAPIPLILSVPIFTLGGFMIKKIFIDIEQPYLASLIAAGFIFNPFLVLLLVYQLDSLGLALSLVLLILPFALDIPDSRKRLIRYHAFCVLCIFCSMNSYQSSLGFFMSLAVIELVYNVYKNKFDVIFTSFFNRIIQLVLAFVAYKLFLSLFFVANIARRAAKSKMVGFSADGLTLFIDHCQHMVMQIVSTLSQQQLIVIGLLFILSVVFVVGLFKKNILSSDTSAAGKVLLIIVPLAPVIIFLFSFLHMAVLKDSYKLQVLTSFSGITAFLFLVAGWMLKNKKALCALLVAGTLSAFGFSYLAGNLVKIEADYHQPTISSLVMDINKTNPDKQTMLYYSGQLQNSHYFHRLVETFPMLRHLDTTQPWALKYQLPYYGCGVGKKNYQDIVQNPIEKSFNVSELPIVSDTFHYTIYNLNSDLLVVFKKP